MHDLTPITALGGAAPRTDTIGSLTIAEVSDLALASVAARLGHEPACKDSLARLLGAAAPGPGKGLWSDPVAGFWTGPDQWMLTAPATSHETLAATVKSALGTSASVTEQSGAWAAFDVSGAKVVEMCELLCAVPVRRMQPGDAQRTLIHQLGCFVLCHATGSLRILGPRASAGSLHHALVTAARAVA